MKKQWIIWIEIIAMLGIMGGISTGYAAEKTLKIAMILWRGETRAEQGFRDQLQESGYAVEYEVFNAGQDKKELAAILFKQVLPRLEEFDYVYTFGTTVSKAVKGAINERVPQIFNLVSMPVESWIVQSLERPGDYISGVTDTVPLNVQIENAFHVVPVRKLGLLFNPREQNSILIRQELKALARQFDFELVDLRSPPADNMLERNLQKLTDQRIEVDAVYLPSDSFLMSNAREICQRLKAAGIKTIAGTHGFVQQGALLGTASDYYVLGQAAADIVKRHQQGEPLGEIPVHRPQQATMVINKLTSEAFALVLTEDIIKQAMLIE